MFIVNAFNYIQAGTGITVSHVSGASETDSPGTVTMTTPEANDFIVLYTSTSGGIGRVAQSMTLDGVGGVRIGTEQNDDGGGQAVTLNAWGFLRSAMPSVSGTYDWVYTTVSGGFNDIAVVLVQYSGVSQTTPTSSPLGATDTNVSTPGTLGTPRSATASRFVATSGSIADNDIDPTVDDVSIESGYTHRLWDVGDSRTSMAVADIQTAGAANSLWTYGRDPVLDSIATQSFVIEPA